MVSQVPNVMTSFAGYGLANAAWGATAFVQHKGMLLTSVQLIQ